MQKHKDKIAVLASPLPFSNKVVPSFAPVGSTVENIVLGILPPRLVGSDIGAIVTIEGHRILKKDWKRVRPKPGTVIDVQVVPMGGGGKNILGTVLTIAVLIAAPYAGAAALTAIAPMGAGITTTAAVIGGITVTSSAIGGLLGAVGLLLVSALAPPPKPSTLGNANNPAESPTQFIEGASNQILQWGRVPVVLGTRRMFPPQAALPYAETIGDDQFARQLFIYGYGDKIIVDQEKIGDTDLSNFVDVSTDYRLDGDLHEGTSLYTNDVNPQAYSVLLSSEDDWTVRTTHDETDEAAVDITFVNGLFRLSSTGKKKQISVEVDIQYRETGTSGPWSPGLQTAASFADRTLPLPALSSSDADVYRQDFVVIDNMTGAIGVLIGGTSTSSSGPFTAPAMPANEIKLATVKSKRLAHNGTTSILSVTDNRDSALVTDGTFGSSGDFLVSNTGTTINVESGNLKAKPFVVTGSQSEALRRTAILRFPTRSQYDIRVKRVTADTDNEKIFDKVYLSSIKSYTYQQPVNLEGVNGVGMFIRGTDQLNGTVDQYNAVISNAIKVYDEDAETWVDGVVSSNPADLYRYVLQGGPNDNPCTDDEIHLEILEAWHAHCTEQGYTYDKIIDYDTSVQDLLADIASAGSASPAIIDGLRGVVIDKAGKDMVQIITPRNSWGYSGEIVFQDLPHAFRVQFPNKEKGYQQDERIVYDDGYNETNATKFEVLELAYCTNADLAFKTGRRHIATARLRPEVHTFFMDIEALHFMRGDRIGLEHDVPVVGVGDARIKTVVMSGDSPDLATGLILDDTITFPENGLEYYVRVRLQDGSFAVKKLVASAGSTKELVFETPFARPFTSDSPAIELLNAGDLLYVFVAGEELDLVVTKIEPQDDFSARITAVNYAPEIFDAENASIPPFTSGLTTPLEFIKPLPPVFVQAQSGEESMLVNSDGSYITRAIFTLDNVNAGDVLVKVKVRKSGDTAYTSANLLEDKPTRVILTGLEDGERYDIAIYYSRVGSSKISDPLLINNYLFVGASEDPSDVENFKVAVIDNTLLFEWDKSTDIDFDHAIIKYSAVYSGAAWNTAQVLKNAVYENRFVAPFLGGTYLIKFVDRLGNESENATAVITYDPSALKNVVQVYTEEPDWLGTKDNTAENNDELILTDTTLGTGYYYFENTLDLGDVYENTVSAAVIAFGAFFADFFAAGDVFDIPDIFSGEGQNDVFDMDDLYLVDDVFGIGADAWAVTLEYRKTDDDPGGTPTWTDWTELEAGKLTFRGIQFRLLLTSYAPGITPRVVNASVTVDMPDRIERGSDLACSNVTGATVTYPTPFKNNPAVVITIQDGDANDEIQYISKDESGFVFKVYNTTTAGFVSRTFDYVSSGYGRVL